MLELWKIKSWAAAHHLCDYPTAAGNPVTVPPVSLQASAALDHFWVGKLGGGEKSGAMPMTPHKCAVGFRCFRKENQNPQMVKVTPNKFVWERVSQKLSTVGWTKSNSFPSGHFLPILPDERERAGQQVGGRSFLYRPFVYESGGLFFKPQTFGREVYTWCWQLSCGPALAHN